MTGSHRTHPPIKKTNERFPPKGTPIKSFFFLVFAIARLDCPLSFFRFFFWKNDLRSEAEQATAGKRKASVTYFLTSKFYQNGTQHQLQRENRETQFFIC